MRSLPKISKNSHAKKTFPRYRYDDRSKQTFPSVYVGVRNAVPDTMNGGFYSIFNHRTSAGRVADDSSSSDPRVHPTDNEKGEDWRSATGSAFREKTTESEGRSRTVDLDSFLMTEFHRIDNEIYLGGCNINIPVSPHGQAAGTAKKRAKMSTKRSESVPAPTMYQKKEAALEVLRSHCHRCRRDGCSGMCQMRGCCYICFKTGHKRVDCPEAEERRELGRWMTAHRKGCMRCFDPDCRNKGKYCAVKDRIKVLIRQHTAGKCGSSISKTAKQIFKSSESTADFFANQHSRVCRK